MKKDSMPMTWLNYINRVFYIATIVVIIINLTSSISIKQVDTMEIEPIYEVGVERGEDKVITQLDYSKLFSYKSDYPKDECMEVSVEEADMLMRIAYAEDRTSVESQAYIMTVVLNRVNSDNFPDTIEEVITQRNSNGTYIFSTVSNGAYQSAIPNTDSHIALAQIESGKISSTALFFEAEWAKNTWQSRNRRYLYTKGATKFYE